MINIHSKFERPAVFPESLSGSNLMLLGHARVVMLGPEGVGKTSIVSRMCSESAGAGELPTVGMVSQSVKLPRPEGFDVALHISDTAGQERFRSLVPMYVRNQDIAVLVFSLAEPSTLAEVDRYLTLVRDTVPPNAFPKLYLVGNKADLIPDGQPPSADGVTYANKIGASYFETSAHTGLRIEDLRDDIASRVVVRESDTKLVLEPVQRNPPPPEKGSCC